MTTEEKIREAFRTFVKEHDDIYDDWDSFKAGYLALLNNLQFTTPELNRELITSYGESEELSLKVSEQAAVIEKLRKGLLECRKLNSLDNVGWSIDVSDAIDELLAIPTDSKQILVDWMREQLGEPVAYHFRDDPACFTMPGSGYSHKYPTEALDIVSLYKLPECLK